MVESERQEIYDRYKKGDSVRGIAKDYPYSLTFIQQLIKSFNYDEDIARNYPKVDGMNMYAICKKTGKEFYVNVSLQNSLDLGLTVTANTIMWWLQQSDEARKSLTESSGEPLAAALQSFSGFIKDCGGKECQVWGNGPTFDISNLIAAYHKIQVPIPWDFRNERCVRTLVSLAPIIKSMTKFYGVAHNALADCYHQIKYCSETYRKIKHLDEHE